MYKYSAREKDKKCVSLRFMYMRAAASARDATMIDLQ